MTLMTSLHDLNTALYERAIFPRSPMGGARSLPPARRDHPHSLHQQQSRNHRRTQMPLRTLVRQTTFDPESWCCCQGSPSLSCHVFLNSFPPRAWCICQIVMLIFVVWCSKPNACDTCATEYSFWSPTDTRIPLDPCHNQEELSTLVVTPSVMQWVLLQTADLRIPRLPHELSDLNLVFV